MKRFRQILRSIGIICLFLLFFPIKQALSISWQMSSNGIKDSYIRSIAFDKNSPLLGYAGSDRAIYKTEDGGKYWKEALGIRGDATKVNFLLIDPSDTKAVYAATQSGLYRKNIENNWRRVFKGKNSFQDNCLCVGANNEKIFLGTQEGLFVSHDNARTWVKTDGEFDKLEVSSIALKDNLIYVATSQGVFKSNDGGESFTKVYAIMRLEDDSDAEEAEDDEEDHNGEYYSASEIHQVVLGNADANKIYLATDKGVIVSEDGAKSWKGLLSIGLASSIINALYLQDNKLFVATDDGVFELVGERWNQIYQGLVTNVINFISSDFKGNLWLATSNGVYTMDLKATESNPDKDIMITKQVIDNFKDEPSIQQIQKKAIDYAEVSPQKIKSWRRLAQTKALIPGLTLDFDKTVTTSLGSTYDRTAVGPQDWGVNLQWDLADFVWSSDQTSIDSRSKLMVELRDSILDEVTRLYFERRRLQIEFLVAPAADTSQRIEKELRLAELTASIDALTGGYLSKMLEQK